MVSFEQPGPDRTTIISISEVNRYTLMGSNSGIFIFAYINLGANSSFRVDSILAGLLQPRKQTGSHKFSSFVQGRKQAVIRVISICKNGSCQKKHGGVLLYIMVLDTLANKGKPVL